MQRRIYRHYFSVQDNTHSHGVEVTGAIHRSAFPWTHQNIRCNYQEVSRMDAVLRYNIEVSEKLIVIYHNFDKLFDETFRFIVMQNPLLQIPDNPVATDILILEYKGRKTPVFSRNRLKTEHEVYAEYNGRWVL